MTNKYSLRKDFWPVFIRVSLLSLIVGVVAYFVLFGVRDSKLILGILATILLVYGIIEACIVFKKRAAYRDEEITRQADYLFASLQCLVVLIPSGVVSFIIGCVIWIKLLAESGYHG